MASYSDKTSWWADWKCDTHRMVGVTFPGWSTPLLVADASAPAWELFASLMRKHGYFFRESAGGTYNCRKISGSDSWSLHAYGIALDLNPSANPYGTHTHDFPQAFIDDVLATGLFKWGISFDDPMHWEIDVPPDQITEEEVTQPLETWAEDAFAWAIKKGFYTNASDVDDVRETLDMQRTFVFLHRYHRKVVLRAISAGGVTAAAVIAEIVARLGG